MMKINRSQPQPKKANCTTERHHIVDVGFPTRGRVCTKMPTVGCQADRRKKICPGRRKRRARIWRNICICKPGYYTSKPGHTNRCPRQRCGERAQQCKQRGPESAEARRGAGEIGPARALLGRAVTGATAAARERRGRLLWLRHEAREQEYVRGAECALAQIFADAAGDF
jgi:hypothetical protein